MDRLYRAITSKRQWLRKWSSVLNLDFTKTALSRKAIGALIRTSLNKAILDKILAKRELITELKAQGATDKEIIEILKNV